MVDSLINIFHYSFMQHAFIAGTIAAILAGIVGYFVIMRQLAFAAHALGHIGFAGASSALLISVTPIMGQFILTLFAAIGMGFLTERMAKSDMAIGVILSFCLGLGSLFLHFYSGYAGLATIILFGNLLGVSTQDIYFMLITSVISLSILVFISKRLLFASIEPDLASAKGLSLKLLSVVFFIILAIAVTLASQVVGVILIFTLLIGPPAIATQFSKHIWSGIALSCVLSIAIVWSSLFLSYFTDWPISFWVSAIVFFLYNVSMARWSSFTHQKTVSTR